MYLKDVFLFFVWFSFLVTYISSFLHSLGLVSRMTHRILTHICLCRTFRWISMIRIPSPLLLESNWIYGDVMFGLMYTNQTCGTHLSSLHQSKVCQKRCFKVCVKIENGTKIIQQSTINSIWDAFHVVLFTLNSWSIFLP